MATDTPEASGVDFRLIFDRISSACLVLQTDAPRFTVLAASDAYLAMARSARTDQVGQGLFDGVVRRPYLTGENQVEALRRSLAQALATGVPTRLMLEAAVTEAAGASAGSPLVRARWAIVNTPVFADDGQVRYLLHRVEALAGGPHESGERERMRGLEQMLEVRTRDLDNALAELEAFSYSVSHDLRAPLRAIDGFAQALAHDYAAVLDAGAQRYLDRVKAGAERMSDLIDDMLQLSRIQRSPLRRARLDIGQLSLSILRGLERQSPGRKVDVEIAPELYLQGDPQLVTIVLEQLIGNAWKFTGKKASAKIRIGSDPGKPPTLFVADDGVGFDMTYASRMFSPFQRLHKATEFEGTGIGLAIAQRIVARHGGRLWAESEVGNGATFRFHLGAGDD